MKKLGVKTAMRVVAGLLTVVVVLAPNIGTGQPRVANAATNAAGGELTRNGSWAAYNLNYAGDGNEVRIFVGYSPADFVSDAGISLDIYSPTYPPPQGERIDSANQSGRSGMKMLTLVSLVGGNYTVIVTNWDTLRRPVQFTLTTLDPAGRPGPALTFVASSEPAITAAATAAPEATAPQPAVDEPQAVVNGTLVRKGDWAAYGVQYAGDFAELRFIVVYTPADFISDNGVTLDVYSPDDPPPGGKKIATSIQGYRYGIKTTSLFSDVPGPYIVVVNNFDFFNRPVDYTILTSDSEGNPGPPLSFVSSRR